MPVGGVGLGFSSALADYMKSERERNRKSEDDQLAYHMELIKSLANRPDINQRPEIMGQAIHDMLELSNAKGGKGKLKGGMAGFMGAHDLPVSQFLKGFSDGSRPFVGDTTELRQQPAMGGGPEIAEPPAAPAPISPSAPMTSLATPVGEPTPEAPTGGEAILNSPIAMPNPMEDGPASRSRLVEAGKGVLRDKAIAPPPVAPPQQATRVPKPPGQQPYFRSPQEMAEQAGQAAGIHETAIQDARDASETKGLLDIGFTLPEIKQMKIDAARAKAGGQNVFQTDKNPDQYTVPGIEGPMDGYTRVNARNGQLEVIDRYGRPLPPGAQRIVKPMPTGSIDQQELDLLVKNEETKLGRKLTPAEQAKVFDDFQTKDSNRKRPTVHVTNTIGSSGLNSQTATALRGVIDKFKASKLQAAAERTPVLAGAIGRVKANPNNPQEQLTMLYSFIQAVDTYQSAVREGELTIAQSTMSNLDALKNAWTGIYNSRKILSPNEALAYAKTAENILNDIKGAAASNEQSYASEANVLGLSSQWQQYRQGAVPKTEEEKFLDALRPTAPIAAPPGRR